MTVRIVVIGAGICGVSTAIWLQRSGHEVILLDKGDPGMGASVQEWMGFRPTPPDNTPLIGQIGTSGIYTGFGHQHIGLSTGPKTGRLIAQLIDGETPNIDMMPYSPERFV